MISAIRAEITKIRAASDDLREMTSISTPNARISADIENIDTALQQIDSLLLSAEAPAATVNFVPASVTRVAEEDTDAQ